MLESHSWPGNVRELSNVVERALVLARGDMLEASLFDLGAATLAEGADETGDEAASVALSEMVGQFERDAIFAALAKAGGFKRRAAQLLGLNERTFWYKLRKHGGS